MQGDALLPLLDIIRVATDEDVVDEEWPAVHEALEGLHLGVELGLVGLAGGEVVHEGGEVGL